jgi:hypothetical protein
VLRSGELGAAVLAALRQLNPALEVVDRGSYVRASAPGECHVTRSAIEAELGRRFTLPGDLELAMTSFRGHLVLDDESARWIEPPIPTGRRP